MRIKSLFVCVLLLYVSTCFGEEWNPLLKKSYAYSEVTPQTSNTAIRSSIDTLKKEDLKYSVERLDNTKGLSNSSVNTIFQDSENLLWIGTWDGLNRYDGNKFKIFRPELNDENSISNQVILKIDEDSYGQIWILTMNGINKYDKKTNSFNRYYFSKQNKPTSSESEFNFAFDGFKNIFCAVKDWGIGYFDGVDFQLIESDLPKNAVEKMEFTPFDELIVLFENNDLYSLKISNNSITNVKFISGNVKTFGITNSGSICIVHYNGNIQIYSINEQSSKKLNRNNVQNVIGNTTDGIILYDKNEYYIINEHGIVLTNSWTNYVNNQKITTIVQGNDNIFWVGTDGDGIIKMYPLNKSFNLVSTETVPDFRESIVRAFSESGTGLFWVGTKGKGLFRFSTEFYTKGENYGYKNFNDENSSINNSVYSLFKGKDNLLFIGTDGDGIYVYDLKNSKLISWSEILNTDRYKSFSSTYAIYQDANGYVWLGTNGYGLIRCKLERKGNQLKLNDFRIYTSENEGENELSSNIIYSIVPRSEEELWVGTRLGGLNLFNKKTNSFKVFRNNPDDYNSISNDDILSLHVGANNKLWIGTSFGLNLLESFKDDGKAIFKNYTIKDGLPNNTIHGIVTDDSSNLWISTNFGISNFIIEEKKFNNYTESEGLQNNEFADGAFYQSNDKKYIFMGGIKGFNYFEPSKIKVSSKIPDLFINRISGQNEDEPYYQSLIVSSDSDTYPSIELKHNQNFFNIELSALTYVNSEKCQYSYKLENFDKDWNFINNRRNISFTNVPPGKYSLWIKWSNNDGVWSNPVQTIAIKIKPVFWQSNLALIIYVLLLFLFLLFILSYYNKRQLLKQNIIFRQKDEEIHQNRLNFFTNIAHEFQTPLTLIIGPIQKLSESINIDKKNKKFIQMIQRNSSRLLFLTQQLLEFRKAEYDYLDVEVKQFDLISLIEQIAELFDEWALQKDIDYKLETPPTLEGWFDKDKVEKIIFNLLSNAFKYTPVNGKIKLTISIEDHKTLHIIVSNTGKGIPKDKLDSLFDRFFLSDAEESNDIGMFRTGIGLAYIKKLVTVIKGEIFVTSKINKITTFKVVLPCDKKSFDSINLNKEKKQVLISQHLQNIMESSFEDTESELPDKVDSINSLIKKQKIILIVEDERDVQMLLKELLEEKYKILTAYNGVEALNIIEKELPDLIISDVMMPEIDGIEFCRRIKDDDRTCHIPIIILTARSSVDHRIEGLESGANSYIPKPFHPDHLLIRVKKLLEERELILKSFNKDNFIENLFNLPIEDDGKDFVRKAIELIQQNIDNGNLHSLFLEKELGVSSSQLYRKIKQIFGFSPGDLIRTIRLKYAAELLQKSNYTVSEICYQSGFNNRSYFYREFKKMYNTTPKNYQLKFKSIKE